MGEIEHLVKELLELSQDEGVKSLDIHCSVAFVDISFESSGDVPVGGHADVVDGVEKAFCSAAQQATERIRNLIREEGDA